MVDIHSFLTKVTKPARYVGGELGEIQKDPAAMRLRCAFCFPDVYDVGMSYLGLHILYALVNEQPDIWCERAFSPDTDMEKLLRDNNLPLFTLESRTPLSEMDVLAFTLQYELSYSNVLNMLLLSGVPLRADQRTEDDPLIICGGPCAVNGEPMADFVDIFLVGEGEESLPALLRLIADSRTEKIDRGELLRRAAALPGTYVPSLYEISYREDGIIEAIRPQNGAPEIVHRTVIGDISSMYTPSKMLVPFCEVVHERMILEVMRGCPNGCRFCQAGFVNRPQRSRAPEKVVEDARQLAVATGYEELSLLSLSTGDYPPLKEALSLLEPVSKKHRFTVTLPSLRVKDARRTIFENLDALKGKSFTFAPEAGTQRMRDVINKNITEEDILDACAAAFEAGASSLKLYFMLGLPFETDEDVLGIASLAERVYRLYLNTPRELRARNVRLTVSVSTFVPKPFTPFQWAPQLTFEEIRRRQQLLVHAVTDRHIRVIWHDADASVWEGVLARGDRRLGPVLEAAVRRGCSMDGWNEKFQYEVYMEEMARNGLDPAFYAARERSEQELFPWSMIETGVSRRFLRQEYERAQREETTPPCSQKCSACGAFCAEKNSVCAERGDRQ